jgi:adenylosuccinate synthase
MHNFRKPGKASVILGMNWGSEGKGGAAAYIGKQLALNGEHFDYSVTNAGAQAGHTSVDQGITRVTFHLPTVPLITEAHGGPRGVIYLDGGAIIDPEGLMKELSLYLPDGKDFFIHPNASVITEAHKEVERNFSSPQARIASTQKGVGEALAQKVRRSALLAKDHPQLKQFVRRFDFNQELDKGKSIVVEVPQGFGLSIDSQFYPHTTSRNCTVGQGIADAGIHPRFCGQVAGVMRTYAIRVGNLDETRHSGGHYPDQRELKWEDLNLVPEITTVTKRQRRVFTFSLQQFTESFSACRPDVLFLTFVDYIDKNGLDEIIRYVSTQNVHKCRLYLQSGPTTDDVRLAE